METKIITTPAGKELVTKDRLNSSARNELRELFLEYMEIDPVTGQMVQGSKISGKVVTLSEKKLIELLVVSYDGSAENIYDRLGETDPSEYDFIVAELNKINTGNLTGAK